MINKKTSKKQANCSKPINEGAPDNNYDYNDAKAFAVIHKIVGDEDTENDEDRDQRPSPGEVSDPAEERL